MLVNLPYQDYFQSYTSETVKYVPPVSGSVISYPYTNDYKILIGSGICWPNWFATSGGYYIEPNAVYVDIDKLYHNAECNEAIIDIAIAEVNGEIYHRSSVEQ